MKVIGVQGMFVYTNTERFDAKDFNPPARVGDIIKIIDDKPVIVGRGEGDDPDCVGGACPIR